MEQKLNKNYPFEVWSLTILLGTILLVIITLLTSHNAELDLPSLFALLLLVFAYSAVLSIPVLVIYYFAHRSLVKESSSIFSIKVKLSGIVTGGIFITFYLIMGRKGFSWSDLIFPFTYIASAVFSTFRGSIYEKNNAPSDKET